jgi:hypothetical protein
MTYVTNVLKERERTVRFLLVILLVESSLLRGSEEVRSSSYGGRCTGQFGSRFLGSRFACFRSFRLVILLFVIVKIFVCRCYRGSTRR